MTRQQQNDFIINKLTEKLVDMPDVQAHITKSFTAWFGNLVTQGAALLKPAPAPSQPTPGEPSPAPAPAA